MSVEIKHRNGTVLKVVDAANLRTANLYGANLQSADLRGANLYGANLYGADLRGADLQSADLRGANLQSANLRGANLYGANLYGADLRGADLQSANLYGANLQSANLRGANLYAANLYGADLRGADLRAANLRGADLRGADLYGADLRGADLQSVKTDDKTIWPHFQICPERGSFTAWKATSKGVIRVRIPKDAQRISSLVGRKCRASHVIVLGGRGVGGVSKHDGTTRYDKGATVRADSFDADPKVECTHGIHFFMTKAEAEEWV